VSGCRPETFPSSAAWSGTSAGMFPFRGLSLIEAGALATAPGKTLAERLGLGTRRIASAVYQTSGRPVQHSVSANPPLIGLAKTADAIKPAPAI